MNSAQVTMFKAAMRIYGITMFLLGITAGACICYAIMEILK